MPCKKAEERKSREQSSGATEKPFELQLPRLNIDLQTAAETPFFDLCDKTWNLVVKASDASNFKGNGLCYPESEFALLLPEHWQVAYAIHAMEYDVLAGGFEQFFENHSDVLIPVLDRGLGAINANVHQSIIRDAAKRYRNEESLDDLDEAFYGACRDHSDPREMLAGYIVANHSKFTE